IFPSMSKSFIKITRLLGKWHIPFGVFALLTGGLHGVLLFLAEGEIGSRELIGIGSFAFVTLAAILGVFLAKNKRIRTLRSIHISLVSAACFLTVVHILLS